MMNNGIGAGAEKNRNPMEKLHDALGNLNDILLRLEDITVNFVGDVPPTPLKEPLTSPANFGGFVGGVVEGTARVNIMISRVEQVCNRLGAAL